MLPQHLVCKYELNCEYCNITLARNKAPWWWSDKIETCRSVVKCFKVFYVKLYVHSLVDKLKLFYENARCYSKIYSRHFFLTFMGVFKVLLIVFSNPQSCVQSPDERSLNSLTPVWWRSLQGLVRFRKPQNIQRENSDYTRRSFISSS